MRKHFDRKPWRDETTRKT